MDCGVVLVLLRFPRSGRPGFVTPPSCGPAVGLGSSDLGQVSRPFALRAFQGFLVPLAFYRLVARLSTVVACDWLVAAAVAVAVCFYLEGF